MSSLNPPVDPLKLIRAAYSTRDTDRNPFNFCTSTGQVIESLSADCLYISIPSGKPTSPLFIFPRSVLTNYRSKRGSGPHYPLDSICFLLERRDDSYTEYLQDARRFGLTIVSLTDKRELIEYLTTTESENYSAIDGEVELPVPMTHFPETTEMKGYEDDEDINTTTNTTASASSKEDKSIFPTRKSNSSINDSLLVRPVTTTASLFKSDKDFTSVAQLFKSTVLSATTSSTSANKSSSDKASLLDQISSMNVKSQSHSHINNSSNNSTPSKTKQQPWIIILPAGSNTLLTLNNANDFLSNSKYISVADARAKGPKPSSLKLEHEGQVFEIIDNPARLAISDWNRVLACFTLTSTWQFKGWKWENPVELFQHIVGFHLYFDDLPVDQTVSGWNVTKLALSRNKRHLDTTAVMNFWNRISEAIKSRK